MAVSTAVSLAVSEIAAAAAAATAVLDEDAMRIAVFLCQQRVLSFVGGGGGREMTAKRNDNQTITRGGSRPGGGDGGMTIGVRDMLPHYRGGPTDDANDGYYNSSGRGDAK